MDRPLIFWGLAKSKSGDATVSSTPNQPPMSERGAKLGLRPASRKQSGHVFAKRSGVADGSRTRYLRSHNPVLYLVSYSHHQIRLWQPPRGKPEGFSYLLCGFGEEIWSGWRDSNPRHPAPKAGALPDCATPRKRGSRPPRGAQFTGIANCRQCATKRLPT